MTSMAVDRKAATWGLVGVALVLAITFLGSGRPGVVRRRAGRLPVRRHLRGVRGRSTATRCGCAGRRRAMLNRRGWDAFRRAQGAATSPRCRRWSARTCSPRASSAVGRTSRWLAHQLVFWGCILAGAGHVPAHARPAALRERRPAGRPLPGVRLAVGTLQFDAESIVGWLIFHALDIAAVLVLAGVFIFLRRRLRDPGALAVERSGDFLALAGLFAVSVTGLFLTVSSMWLEGRYYSALNTIHALTVILGLMYIPFGKLFHIFQRPGNLGVAVLQAGQRRGPAGRVPRAAASAFASAAAGRRPQGRARRRSASTTIDCRRDGGNYQDTLPDVPPRARSRSPSRRASEVSADGPTDRSPRRSSIDRYGPHLNEAPPGGWDAGIEPDRVVKTHCCFCGQQCGIKLKVQDNEVVGFEPWYEFPFNEGKLCPKGVKRYLQGSHPDRLLAPARARPVGARRVPADQLGRRRSIASSPRSAASRPRYGDDAFAMLVGRLARPTRRAT